MKGRLILLIIASTLSLSACNQSSGETNTQELQENTVEDEDLNNFYLTQLWYIPEVQATDFDDNVFNEYEKYNLELLSKLDTY